MNRTTVREPGPLEGGATIELYWIPLGAGGNFVRLNGRLYESIIARLQRRPVCDLYHSALQVFVPEGRYVIEQTPIVDKHGPEHGVVGEGSVGARWAGLFRMFRYEIRRWRNGVIPDLNEAVDSPRRVICDLGQARQLLDVVPDVPKLVWGRDEVKAGEMWNSNSIISWMLTRIGFDAKAIKPPAGGRAPGWKAGIVAARQTAVAREPRSQVPSDDLRHSSMLPTFFRGVGEALRNLGPDKYMPLR